MTTYYITILLVFGFLIMAQKSIVKDTGINNEITYKKTPETRLFFILASISLIFVAGFRYDVGSDYSSYYFSFNRFYLDLWQSFKELDEPGIKFVAKIINIVGGNATAFVFACAFITIVLFLATIYKNTDMLLLATLLYVFMGCWHGAFNGIRQYLAAAIIFAGINFIKERKFWKYALIIFIAFLFHASAIIMIFPYFIAYNKINFRNIALLIIASVIVLFSFSELLDLAGFILRNELTESDYITTSVNILRVLVAIVPAVFFILVYSGRPVSKEQRFWLNFLIINGIVMFATSNSAYFARIGIYTAPFSALGIAELVKGLKPREKKVFSVIIVIAYFLFWLYSLQTSVALNNFQWVFGK